MMKKTNFFRISLLLLLFAFVAVPISCGSDDSDPVVLDADSDGVADADDACPDVAGVIALAGCPDADEDGIADKDDTCPNEAGVAALDGCPEDAKESTVEAGPSILKLNCGGAEITIGADTFLADQYKSSGSAAYIAHKSVTEIENTDLDEIYLTETITTNNANQGPVSYVIPVSNGTYTVKLHFAEIYWGVTKTDANETLGGVGSRIFDIDIEGMSILNNFDVIAVTGAPAKAITKMYDVEVTDGELNIVFTSTVDKPKVSAIEVFGDGAIVSVN